jgi:ABC-2 type transport system permease protein
MKLSRIRAIIIRHIYNFRHHLDRLTDSFYWPIIDIVIWGLTSQYIQGTNTNISHIVLILLTALVFWQIVWRGQYEITVNFLEEIWSQNLVNLFATTLTVNEWIVGVILLGIIKMLITVTLSAVLIYLLYSINILTFGFLLIPFFASLIMMGWWVGLIVTAFLVMFGRQIQTMAWAGVYLIAPFSAIYYPVSSLPAWGQIIAKAIPASYIFEGMRQVILTNQLSSIYLIKSFILNIIYLGLSIIFFKWAFKQSLKKGLARLE